MALMGLGSVGLTIVILVSLVAGVVLAVFGPAAALVKVPDVAGLPKTEAEQRLQAARLTMKIINYEYDPNVKEGSIISFHPYAGKQVRAGREVRVWVSRGSRVARAPRLKGLTMTEARDRLAERDLQVGEEERRASDEPADIVLSQDPAPATVMKRKAKVNVVVSGGKGFGVYDLGDRKFIFRTLQVIVPQGRVLQLVEVDVSGDGMDKSFYERLCRPGEVVEVDLYGPEGARVRVKIEDERVFSARL